MQAISFDEFLVRAASPRTFAVTYAALEAPRLAERHASVVCLYDEAGSFFLFNQAVALSRWIPETDEYTDDVFETVILAGSAEAGRDLVLGDRPRFELDWPGGPMIWMPVDFRRLEVAGGRVKVLWGVVAGRCFGARGCGFLLDLRLGTAEGAWRLRRGDLAPDFMALEPVPTEGAESVRY